MCLLPGSWRDRDEQEACRSVDRNASQTGVDWRFTTSDARIKLKQLYLQIQN